MVAMSTAKPPELLEEDRRLCLSAPDEEHAKGQHRRGCRTGEQRRLFPVRPRYHTPAPRGLSTNWVDGRLIRPEMTNEMTALRQCFYGRSVEAEGAR